MNDPKWDRLEGLRVLHATWELFKGNPVYDAKYVWELELKIQKLEIELGWGSL